MSTYKLFTYEPGSGETPDDVRFVNFISNSIWCNVVKTREIDSPAIELIDMRLVNSEKKIDDLERRVLQLETFIYKTFQFGAR